MARMRKLQHELVENAVALISLTISSAYNKLPDWDYSKLATAFGPGHPSKYYGPIGTPEELDDLLADKDFGAAKCFQLVELKLGRLDAPLPLRMTTAAVEAFNQRSKDGTSVGA